ncbi:MAG: DNA-3-methyladenine glycosylase I [Bacteroidales bacterium]|nr:DNA-3-methyladenine glycosylase I [Bacteroidales bacterium]
MLRKRENFRRAFDGFDVEKVAAYDAAKVESLLQDEGIIYSHDPACFCFERDKDLL